MLKDVGKHNAECHGIFSTSSSSSTPRRARAHQIDGGFAEVSHKRPGHLLEKAIQKMGSYHSSLHPGAYYSQDAELKPVVGAYVQSVLIPARQGQISLRNLQELKTLSTTMDLMLLGRQAEACDVLAQRFLAVETADLDGNWGLAKHYELITDGSVSAATDQQKRQAMNLQRQEVKFRKDQQSLQAPRKT